MGNFFYQSLAAHLWGLEKVHRQLGFSRIGALLGEYD